MITLNNSLRLHEIFGIINLIGTVVILINIININFIKIFDEFYFFFSLNIRKYFKTYFNHQNYV